MEHSDADKETSSMSEIQSFFSGTSVFITGATGFLGHVLLSKLLRCCPDIKQIFILLREKRGKTAMERYQEMMQDEVFEKLKTDCPESLLKIRPVVGDCLLPKLGLHAADRDLLKEEVNIVFHVAATVRFDAPLRQAVNMNIRSTRDLLDLAQEMKQLKSFVHVSTAFSNCVDRKIIEEKLYDSPISPESLMLLVENFDDEVIERITPGLLGNYPNTYVFTKAIAEDVCRTKGANLPIVIFRPAIVISSVKEPIPGWINNVYGPTGVVAAAAVGLLKTLHSDKDCKANVVPCDYVVNAAIAAAWSVGTIESKQDNPIRANCYVSNGVIPNACTPTVITNGNIPKENTPNGNIPNGNVSGYIPSGNLMKSEVVNANDSETHLEDTKKIPIFNYSCDLLEKPFTWKQFMWYNELQEPKVPSSLSIWAYTLTLVKYKPVYKLYCILLHLFPAFIFDTVARCIGKEPKLMDAYRKLHKLADVLSYFSTREWVMTHDNVSYLWNRLSKEDKELFDFNLQSIDWMDYFFVHCQGIRKFILKESPDTIPVALRKRLILRAVHYLLLSTIAFMSFYVLFSIVRRVVS